MQELDQPHVSLSCQIVLGSRTSRQFSQRCLNLPLPGPMDETALFKLFSEFMRSQKAACGTPAGPADSSASGASMSAPSPSSATCSGTSDMHAGHPLENDLPEGKDQKVIQTKSYGKYIQCRGP